MKLNLMIKNGNWALALVLLLGVGILVAGCESDAVAPQDELPAPTEREAAQQAGLVAAGVAKVGPQLLTFSGAKAGPADLGVYPYDFEDEETITGEIILEYFNGGPEGDHSDWNDADYGLLYTPKGKDVTVTLDLGGGVTPIFSVTFDLNGPIDQTADTATVSGTGTFTTLAFFRDFTLTDVLMTAVSTYPEGGAMEFIAGSITVTVTYDGTRYVTATVPGGASFQIDLDTGIATPVAEE